MKTINHPNIIHLYDYLETDEKYYLVITFCDGGDMEEYIKKKRVKYLEESECVSILK